MNKKEYIAATAEKTDGISKATVEEVLKAFTETITEGLIKGERIPIVGLGAFETADVEERIGKNPKTGQPVNIPARRKPKFKISKTLKELVRNPISFS